MGLGLGLVEHAPVKADEGVSEVVAVLIPVAHLARGRGRGRGRVRARARGRVRVRVRVRVGV